MLNMNNLCCLQRKSLTSTQLLLLSIIIDPGLWLPPRVGTGYVLPVLYGVCSQTTDAVPDG